MLLKFTKTSGAGGAGSGTSSSIQATTTYAVRGGTGMRMTMSTNSTMSPRIHRKGFRIPSKRQPGKGLPGKLHTIARTGPGKLVPGKRIPQRPHPPPCDNSNDSGLGFDQHTELRNGTAAVAVDARSSNASSSSSSSSSSSCSSSSSGSSSSGISGSGQHSNLIVNSVTAGAASSSSLQQQHHHQQQQQQQQQQQPQQQQQQQQQQQPHQHPQQQQHSPQQHLIRAIPVSRSRHAKKMLNYLDEIEADSSATFVDDLITPPSNDEDTGFGTDSNQATASTTSATSISSLSSELFGGLFSTTLRHKTADVVLTVQQPKSQQLQQQQQQHYQQQQQQQQQQLPQQQLFQYPGLHLQLQQQQEVTSEAESSGSSCVSSGRGGKHLKRRKLECNQVELDNDDACSEDEFIRKIATVVADSSPSHEPATARETLSKGRNNSEPKFIGTRAVTRVANKRQPTTPLNSIASSNDGQVQLEIVSQPEQQHRARYQTEGSRGAVKDRSGNGFPIVRLTGYDKAAVLQVFIGTDIGRVAPHMFYQACKVAGKNSTQCNEKKVDGTMVIEIDFKPETDMTITCDCVGILKERNVDVEHRFPEHLAQKNKKKSTRCRMVFRTQLTRDDGSTETLQVCSNPIICTQPPGVPEICKKSLNSCPVDGGLELFIIGKNFLKDTHVVFQETYDSVSADDPATEIVGRQQLIGGTSALWEQSVLPDKEYLHQTHLICTVPPYLHQNLLKPVSVQVSIISSGKKSEPHTFTYTPKGSYTTLAAASTLSSTMHSQDI